ncbi:hypothetical protein WJX72_010985 [[Myrmecia] bisecta]|uniref:Uncharacterized protein n=1 Tax=[Myrmecia] bisecta TaxID=41462 RepID=A0AAW1PTY7_9CHLO
MGCCFSKPASRQAVPPVTGAALASPSAQSSNKQSEAELVDKVSANILGALTITRSLPPLVGLDNHMEKLLNGPALQQDQEELPRRHGPSTHETGRPQELQGLRPEMVHACARLPLTLKVLGSFLRGKSPAIWTETLASLRRAEDLPVDDNHKRCHCQEDLGRIRLVPRLWPFSIDQLLPAKVAKKDGWRVA